MTTTTVWHINYSSNDVQEKREKREEKTMGKASPTSLSFCN